MQKIAVLLILLGVGLIDISLWSTVLRPWEEADASAPYWEAILPVLGALAFLAGLKLRRAGTEQDPPDAEGGSSPTGLCGR